MNILIIKKICLVNIFYSSLILTNFIDMKFSSPNYKFHDIEKDYINIYITKLKLKLHS